MAVTRPATGARSWIGPLVVGLAAGFLSGLFGVGGGILIVPGLVFALGLPQRLAHGTSLVATVLIASSSALTYAVDGSVHALVAALMVPGAFVGVVIGTSLLKVLPARLLQLAFAAVLLATAVRMFIAVSEGDRDVEVTPGLVVGLLVLGLVAGVLAGLLGVGGGIVMVPAMVVLFGIEDVLAKGTSLLAIIPTAIVGTRRNLRNGNADLRVGAIVGASGVLSAVLGARLAAGLDEDLSHALFGTLLVVTAARLLWESRKADPHGEPAEVEDDGPR